MQSAVRSQWKRWFQRDRLIALLTILGAGIAVILDLLGVISLSVAEDIIITLLALLAIDALNERLSLLERILVRLSGLSAQIGELNRSNIRIEDRNSAFKGTLEESLKEAQRLDILGLTLRGVVATSWGCFDKMAERRRSNRLRFLIVKPGSAAVDSAAGFPQPKAQREREVQDSKEILGTLARRDNVELRCTSVAPPFSLLIVDPQEPEGTVQVELYGQRVSPEERPHFTLTRDNQPWYDFFVQQFEAFWQEAETLEQIDEYSQVTTA